MREVKFAFLGGFVFGAKIEFGKWCIRVRRIHRQSRQARNRMRIAQSEIPRSLRNLRFWLGFSQFIIGVRVDLKRQRGAIGADKGVGASNCHVPGRPSHGSDPDVIAIRKIRLANVIRSAGGTLQRARGWLLAISFINLLPEHGAVPEARRFETVDQKRHQ